MTLNYNSPDLTAKRAPVDEIVLIQDVELVPVEPGDTITAPIISGVTYWYLISDFAMEKVNKIRIDRSRME